MRNNSNDINMLVGILYSYCAVMGNRNPEIKYLADVRY